MKEFIVYNPYTLEPIGIHPLLDMHQIHSQLKNAHTTQLQWQKLSVSERIKRLHLALDYFRTHQEQISLDICHCVGKPITQARAELTTFIQRFEYLLDHAYQALAPNTPELKTGFIKRIERVPKGVIYICSTWNYPLLVTINGVLTALLAGNTVLLRHSEQTFGIGEHFARAFSQPSIHEDLSGPILYHVTLDRLASLQLIKQGAINHVIFTGSVAVGTDIYQAVAHNNFIDCQLELGGKDGAYVAEDAILADAIDSLVDGCLYNAGQSCCAIERIYVHQSHYQAFIEGALAKIKNYTLGDPTLDSTDMGPLAQSQASQKLIVQVEQALASGAQLLHGGHILKIGHGTFFEPTLVTDINNSMIIAREENFGPIVAVAKATDDAHGFRQVSDSHYGLTAAIFTQDVSKAERFAQAVDVGTVFMNRCDYLDPCLPWSGVKNSGKSATLGLEGFHSVTRPKSLHFKLN